MSKRILIANESSELNPCETYRRLDLVGATESEEGFRIWVSETWRVDRNLPLGELAKAAKAGGWICMQEL
jgi:hypothetical protein